MRGKPTTQNMHNAETWARKALSILEDTRAKAQSPVDLCEQALAVTLFNVASIREVCDHIAL